jgi:hypothetical protein
LALIAGLGNITNIALLYLLPVMLAAARLGCGPALRRADIAGV